ncbi:protocadherin-16-like [Neolamprologus brichardi]|uniref:protocadherin-16-like n=1 Tax=Neolamprologus brichardi TaxID=32507 RepID=UPI0003EBBB64|nr:protocadherin-16-like [Neolamprologus brichardi]
MPITSKGSRGRSWVSEPCVRSRLWHQKVYFYFCVILVLVQTTTVLGALELQLDEEQPAGTIVGDISAGLPPGETASLYFISDHEGTGVSHDLNIDETTGIITTARRLDREQRDHYNFIAVTMTGVTIEVSITVNDINDHAPVFPKKSAVLKIPEHTAVGTRFSLEPATDADKDQLTTQGYAIREGNVGQTFKLETKRGANKALYLDLVVNGLLDREKRSSYTLVIEAFDGGSPRKMGSMTLEVTVTDINDHAPVFNQSRYHSIISESLPQGSSILQVFATDEDEGDNGLVLYEINRRQSDPERYFVIDVKSGVITLNKPLDYELKRVHELVVQARDNASHPEVTNAFVTIHVRDYNDNQPTMTIIFLSEDGSPRISEGAQPGQYVARISVTDPDYGEYANVNVSLEGGDGKFALTTKDSIIYLIYVDQVLDREERDSYDLRVMATDSGTPPLRAESSFTIQVTDVNDNPPLFDQQAYRQTIPEVVYPGSFVLQVTARDKDQGPNGDVRYSLLKGKNSHSDWFSIDPVTGIITTATALDFESEPAPSVTVVAMDSGRPPLSSTAKVDIVLQDVNDNTPVFSSNFYNTSIKENTPAGTCFLEVSATDEDRGSFGTISYNLGSSSGNTLPTQFTINKETGQLCTSTALDRDEGLDKFDLTVTAIDGGGLSSVARVRVTVVDINDNRPIFYPVLYTVSLSTHSAPGTSVVKVTANDPDVGENGRVTYRTVPGGGSSFFTLNKDTGVISLSRSLHGKANTVISMVISAEDGGGLTAPVNARVNVSIVGGSVASPVFEQAQYFFTVSEDVLRGTAVGVVRASAKTGGSKDIFYSISSGDPHGYFTVDSASGTIRTALPLDHETCPSLDLEIQARFGSPPAYGISRVHITIADINDNAPTFLPSSSESLLLPEITKMGTIIYRIQATDKDSGHNGQLSFDLVSAGAAGSSGQRTFGVDRGSGEVRLIGSLSYESVPRYDLQVAAKDGGAPQLSSTFTLVVHIQAQDAQGPNFDTLTYRVELRENTPLNTRFLQVRALNREASGNGSLSILKSLDREEQEIFNLTIVAEDHGIPQLSTSQVLCVQVIDVNDEAPVFLRAEFEAQVMENQGPGASVLTVTATDRDQGSNGQITYGGVSEEGFIINPVTGAITTTKELDTELQDHYTLTVYARDGGLPPNFAKTVVRVEVQDVNDNAPIFAKPFYGLEVPENQAPVELCILKATDPDSGPGGELEYRIAAGDPDGDFQLHASTGALSTSRGLDRETHAKYTLEVVATDRGSPALSATVAVEVNVLDVNDNNPVFSKSSYSVEISEDATEGAQVLEVSATDADEDLNGKVLYFLSQEAHGAFSVDEHNGRITTSAPLDREKLASYSFQVFAVDLSPAAPRNSSAQVTVTVLDVNDNTPFFIQDPLVIEVSNRRSQRVLATMKAEDKDFGANGSVFYRFATPVKGFSINSLTGEIQATERLADLTQAQRTLIVEAMDQGSPAQSTQGVVIIYVKEVEYSGIRFSRNARDVSIQENAAKGTTVAQAQAQYPDGSRNGISYSLFSGNRKQAFSISTSTGEIRVRTSNELDFEDTPRLRLVVKAETVSSTSYMAFNLILQDVNDNLPRFQLQNYVAYMKEAQGYEMPIIQVVAEDVDQGQNGQVTYSIQSSSMSGLFKIDPVTGSITTAAIMDREIFTQTKLVVTATDRGSPRLAGSATLTVIIVDQNDNSPTIPMHQEIRIPENTLIGTEITLVTGNDVDSSPALSYSLQLDPTALGKFGIHRYSGGVSLTAPLDFEEKTWYTLTVRATDSQHQTEANITILVEDINDNAPAFTHDLYQVTLPEHTPPGSAVITVTATDRDSGENGRITYKVMSSTKEGFYIDPSNGTLFINHRVEFDPERPSVSIVIEARDRGLPPLSSLTTVQVQISDVNDNAPVFHQSEYRATVSEDTIPGSTVLTFEAFDSDLSRENCGFDFAIASGNEGNAFQIESSVRFLEGRGFQTVGTLLLAEGVDFETKSLYNLTVVVSDRGVPQRSSSVAAVITIGDVNDNPPAFTRAEYTVSLIEGATAGTEIIRLTATDPDSTPNAEVQYSISSGNEVNLFTVDPWSGALKLQRALDREHQPTHVVIVQATDGQGHFALAPVIVEVKDVNDNHPFFPVDVLIASIRENQPANSAVTVLHAIDHDTGVFGQLKYYMLERSGAGKESFAVDQNSGEIRSKIPFDFEKVNTFSFVAVAADSGNHSATVTVQVFVTGEDEYDPLFTSSDFSFEVPEGAKKGQSIGQVQASDEDEGVDGIVLYSLTASSPYFDVNKTTGVVFLKLDSSGSSSSSGSGRSKRETRVMTLDVQAHSPLDTSRTTTAEVSIDVTNTNFGLAADVNILVISIVAVSLGFIILLVVMAVVVFLVKSRRKKKGQETGNRTVASGTALQKLDDCSPGPGGERIYHQALPGYAGDQGGAGGGPYTRGGSLDPSHSSGRGSAEAAEDDEIRMINEYPRVASITSSMQEHISARGPDSGIQQDADQLSDISCEPAALEGSTWFKGKKLGGSLSGTLLSGQLPVYRDEGGSYLGVGRGLNISLPKDYAFPEDGKPSVDGSLTAIVASDEELRGSYNWDYLLNWCPQFQPLANVFTEIARLKDETAQQSQNPRQPFQPKPKMDPKPRIDPPPLITSVAHPGAMSVPPKVPVIGRTFPHLASLRRSPISHEGSISSAAMSPSFSPSLSPLAARSPAVSPFGVNQGPSASMISTREPSLEQSPDHEMRI